MAKNGATKSAGDAATVEKTTVAVNETVEKDMNENNKETTKKAIKEDLNDFDEIEIVSLVPNVSYKDSKTLDMYEWEEVGHVESMTFDVLKNMWRNNKGYFKNLCLKPMDDRVINKFGLTKTFEKYEFLMDESNYTKKNIKDICEAISETPNGLKYSIVHKVKDLVVNGEISDIFVIRELEKHLKIDLISFL